ncbi:MAG: type II toxin-antitoxin system VapC family toxin [Nanoarchaeota archaeon]|nr:type II toxin-antitoxin system VapC family toxin [Nanoarchaeota archaeon]
MTSMIRFIDANVFLTRWSDERSKALIDGLNSEEHCTSVLVLAEVYHKLAYRNANNVFEYIRTIMGAIKVQDITQSDFFNAVKNPAKIDINDKINIEVMRRNGILKIISYDKDFDKEQTIKREEP